MLQFLQPIWLWAIAGIAVPALIHLWNRKQGKTLKVGSIALFTNSVKSHAKSFRLTDIWLLLLRCFLLILLAMLLAKPVWNKPGTAKEKGWILIEQKDISTAYKTFQPMIDSLLKCGYSFHYFDESFTKADIKEALQKEENAPTESHLSYWTLLKMLDDKVPADFPVYVFTNNHLQRFQGNRPEVSLPVKWYTFLSPDTTANWLQKAYINTNESLHIATAQSNSIGTYYSYQNLSLNDTNNAYKIKNRNGNIVIESRDSSHQIIEADTTTVLITIYANQFFADANYLKAAINAIKDFTQYKIKVLTVNKTQNIPANSDWLFWLSEDIMPELKMKNNVFIYEKGKIKNTRSALICDDKEELTIPDNISIYKYIKSDSIYNRTIWKNGFNEPVLSKQNRESLVYHFYSRFNPQWSDLVWSSSFPQLMYNLIFDTENTVDKNVLRDKRIIDSSQILPQFVSRQSKAGKQNNIINTDISQALWCIAFAVFLIERILSFRLKKVSHE